MNMNSPKSQNSSVFNLNTAVFMNSSGARGGGFAYVSMSKVRTAVRFFPEGVEPLWARAVTRGHAPLYEESWALIL